MLTLYFYGLINELVSSKVTRVTKECLRSAILSFSVAAKLRRSETTAKDFLRNACNKTRNKNKTIGPDHNCP